MTSNWREVVQAGFRLSVMVTVCVPMVNRVASVMVTIHRLGA